MLLVYYMHLTLISYLCGNDHIIIISIIVILFLVVHIRKHFIGSVVLKRHLFGN